MRRVIVQEFVSVDGLASGPEDVDFIPASVAGDRSFGQRQVEFMDSVDAILLGRVTYELFAEYWPNVTSGEDKEFADKINRISKVVFSKTLDRAPWGSWPEATIVRSDAAREVGRLKRQSGKDMVIWGSISLAQSLLAAGKVDEIQLIVCPVVLATGRRLFDDQHGSSTLEPRGSRSFDRGAVLLQYGPR